MLDQLIKRFPTQDAEWLSIKVLYAFISGCILGIMIFSSQGCPIPTGIFKLYTFDFLFTETGKIVLGAAILVLYALFLLEMKMVLVTLLLSLFSCIIISYHESNGIFFRATIFTVIFAAIFIAYLRKYLTPSFDLRKYRIQYALQVIAATYTLAGISKLQASGIGWGSNGPLFSLQVIKNYSYLFYDTGSAECLQKGYEIAYGFIHHSLVIKLLLSISLFLEVSCFAALFGNRLKLTYGLALLGMHIGIMVFMGIGISAIAYPMVIFFLNPLYRLTVLMRRFYTSSYKNRAAL